MMGNSFLKGDNVETLIDVEIGDDVAFAGCYAYVMETEPEKDNIYVHVPGFGHTTVHKFDLRLLSHRTPAATPPTGAPAAGEGVLERPFLAELKLSHHIEFLRKVIEQGSIEEYGILPKELHTAGWLEHSNELSSTLTGNVLVPTEKAYQFIAAQLATLQADNARLADELARARAALEAESMAHDIVLKQLKALQDAYDALGDEFEAQS